MAGVLQHLRSSTLDKRPNPASMVDGQVAINYASGAPGMFFKDNNGALVKVGPVHVGSGAPNAVPASGGTAGNSMGEQWLDTSGGTYVFKIWDGSAWRSEAGEFVNVTGDTMTGALGIIAGSAASPSLFISGDANTGLYSPGADQLAISTNGTGRLFVGSTGSARLLGASSGQEILHIDNTATYPATNAIRYTVASNSNWADVNHYAQSHRWFANGNTSEALRITSDGKLGLGTSSAQKTLHILNPGSTYQAELRLGGASTYYFDLTHDATTTGKTIYNAYALTGTSHGHQFQVSGTNALLIDASGRVGIGSIAPSTILHISSASPTLRISDTSGTASNLTGQILFQEMGTTSAMGRIGYVGGDAILRVKTDGAQPIVLATNDAERARLTSDGKLGLGTSSPTAPLTIAYSGAEAQLQINNSGNNRMIYLGAFSANEAILRLFNSSNVETVRIPAESTAGVHTFFNAGNVGIGVTGPTKTLEVKGDVRFYNATDANSAILDITADATGSNGVNLASTYFGSGGFGPIRFTTSSTERARLTSDGKLGLGTSSPSNILEVSSNGTSYIRSTSTANSISGVIGAATSAFDVGTTSSHAMNFYTAGVNRATLDTSGRLGIGTTSPSATLHVATTGSPEVLIGGTATPILSFVGGATTDPVIGYANGSLRFATVTGAGTAGFSEKARLTSDGKLLVGTSTAFDTANTGTSWLAGIEKPSGYSALSIKTNEASANGAYLNLGKSRGTTANSKTIVNDNDELGGVYFEGADGASMHVGARVAAFVDGTPGAGDLPTRLVFSTTADGASSPTERMRITSSGFLKASSTNSYYDVTNPYHELRNNTSNQSIAVFSHNGSSGAYGVDIRFPASSPDNNSNYFLVGADSTANRCIIYSDGDVWTSDAGTLTSDVTLKRNITDATPKLADVMNLRVRNFYWEEDYHPNKQDKKLIGFIAQEFEEVFPGLVSEHKIKGGDPILDEDGNETGETTPEIYKKGIKEGKLIPILVKALQEAVERIETLEAEVAALKAA